MAEDIERLLVRIEANAQQFERQMKQVNRSLHGAAAENRRTYDRMRRDAEKAGREIGESLGRGIATASTIAGVALAGISAYAIKLAADAEEIRNAFSVAFGSASKDAEKFAQRLSDTLGRDVIEIMEAMSRLQLVITGTGVAADKAASMVQALTERGIDIGSLFNVSDAQAMQAIISGITGETEPLKRFGVVLNQAAVEAELLRLGFKGNASEASEAAKAIARANIILEKTAVAQGDAAKTAGSASNSAKAMRAEFNKAARDLGEILLPHVTKATKAVTAMVGAFNDMGDGVKIAGLAILAFIAGGGPIAGLLANIDRVVKAARLARAELGGMTGGGVLVGGKAPKRSAGLLGLFGPGATVGLAGAAAVGINDHRRRNFEKVLADPGKATDAQLADAIEYSMVNYRDLQGSPQFAGTAAESRFRTFSGANYTLGEERRRRLASASPAGGSVDTGVVGGFTLSPDLMRPTGGGAGSGGGRRAARSGSSAPSQIELAARRTELDLLHAINLAVLTGGESRLRILGDELKMQEEVAALKAAGYSQTDAETIALTRRVQLNEALIAHAKRLAELRPLEVDAEGVENSTASQAGQEALAANEDAMRDTFRRTFGDGVRAALKGDLEGLFLNLADSFVNRMIDRLSDEVFTMLMQLGQQSGGQGNGNWFSAALGVVGNAFSGQGNYAGGRATGGSVAPGQWVTVGERGIEAAYAKPGGGFEVLSNGALKSLRKATARPVQSQGRTVVVQQSLFNNFDGAVMTEDLMRQMDAKANVAAQRAYRGAVETARQQAPQAQRRLAMLGTP